jgi:NO-binding membrane sensor protein with MHYT domain
VTGTYSPSLVILSVLIAVFVSFTALNLSARVAEAKNSDAGGVWLLGGAIAMGTGIWSMHFIGMLAFSLPIPLAYDIVLTIASLIIAVVISGFALWIASSPEMNLTHYIIAAILMGLGISAMHYTGMASIQILPMVSYELDLLLASVAIAITASFAALWLFFHLRRGTSFRMRLARVAAAFVMGLAISGMHYTGMAASRFDADSICTTSMGVTTEGLAGMVTGGVVAVLSITTFILVRHSRSRVQPAGRSVRHAAR